MHYYENSNAVQREFIETVIRQDLGPCQSHLVEELLRVAMVDYEDIRNLYPDNSDEIEALHDQVGAEEDKDTPSEDKIGNLESAIEDLMEEQEEPREPMEWWHIDSGWLRARMLEAGEVVLDTDYGAWWGRCCTGQCISLDPTFWAIYRDGVESRA